jgi:hypothetical protein
MLCGAVWRGVVWCGVAWLGVVWCGVVWTVVFGYTMYFDSLDIYYFLRQCQITFLP